MSAHASHPVWKEIAPEFTRAEFKRPDSMDPNALRKLHKLRVRSKVPGRLVSDARVESSGVGVSGSAHNRIPCTATDQRVHDARERFAVLEQVFAGNAIEALEAIAFGQASPEQMRDVALRALRQPGLYTRVGIYPPTASQAAQWGKNSGSIHVDSSSAHPPRVAWVDY